MKVIYAATPQFAIKPLEALLDSGVDVALVITQTDKMNARGNKVVFSPVKQAAIARGIEVYQPQRINTPEAIEKIATYGADILITAAYGQILREAVLNLPRLGSVNIHASALPRWRGAAPINRAIMAGDAQSGVTIMQMDCGMDTGDILLLEEVAILPEMTAGELHDALSVLGACLIKRFVKDPEGYLARKTPQDDAQATHAAKLDKAELFLDFNDAAETLHNKIRGLSPAPGARCFLDGKLLKILRSEIVDKQPGISAGSIVAYNHKDGFVVAAKDACLRLKSVQLEGKKALGDDAFIRGYQPAEAVLKPVK